jgi:pyruvate-formate lyase-activating enzyme
MKPEKRTITLWRNGAPVELDFLLPPDLKESDVEQIHRWLLSLMPERPTERPAARCLSW